MVAGRRNPGKPQELFTRGFAAREFPRGLRPRNPRLPRRCSPAHESRSTRLLANPLTASPLALTASPPKQSTRARNPASYAGYQSRENVCFQVMQTERHEQENYCDKSYSNVT